ncbi:MAG: hypothetical protein AB9882_09315 [Ignavibacteriaceae bacterium]
MKYLFFVIIIFTFFACSKEDVKFELTNPEVFAYDLGDEWEVNTSVVVKGFQLKESDQKFISKLSFNLNLTTPEGVILKSMANGVKDSSFDEKKNDLSLDAQFSLDSSYALGTYKLIINIKDELSQKSLQIEKDFELTDED